MFGQTNDTVSIGVRVATWNLARPVSGRRRRTVICEHIAAVDADIWVLTETHDGIVPGDNYRSAVTSGVDRPGALGERWVTIWSRFPIQALAATSDPVRAVAARVEPPNGAPLIVYGAVLPWLGSPWRGVEAAGGRAFAEALKVQALDWRVLRAAHPNHDLIVAGDFNQDLAETHYYGSQANRECLVAALKDAGLVVLTGGVADPVRASSAQCACIDHICISTPARWLLRRVGRWPDLSRPDRRLSDHFGIVAEFAASQVAAADERRGRNELIRNDANRRSRLSGEP